MPSTRLGVRCILRILTLTMLRTFAGPAFAQGTHDAVGARYDATPFRVQETPVKPGWNSDPRPDAAASLSD
jgi:hypothetical protein